MRGIHRWPVNSPHKGPATRKMFPFDGVIMSTNNRWNPHINGRWCEKSVNFMTSLWFVAGQYNRGSTPLTREPRRTHRKYRNGPWYLVISRCPRENWVSLPQNIVQKQGRNLTPFNTLKPRQNGRFQVSCSDAFTWLKIYEFRLKCHWSLFLWAQLTIFQHWLR